MKAGADLQQARHPPAQPDAPCGRLGDAAQDLEQRALAGAVPTDDANDLAALDLETDVLERPEFLDLVALNDLAAAKRIDCLSREVPRFPGNHVAQRGITFALSRTVADQGISCQRFSTEMTVSDMLQIRSAKRLFRLAELADAEPKEKAGHGEAEPKSRPIDPALAAKQAPAEPIDDADHRIEGIEEPPLTRNDVGAEAHRRHVQARAGL